MGSGLGRVSLAAWSKWLNSAQGDVLLDLDDLVGNNLPPQVSKRSGGRLGARRSSGSSNDPFSSLTCVPACFIITMLCFSPISNLDLTASDPESTLLFRYSRLMNNG